MSSSKLAKVEFRNSSKNGDNVIKEKKKAKKKKKRKEKDSCPLSVEAPPYCNKDSIKMR